MRILIISNLFPPATHGGYEILCAQVADRLHARGHEVQILTAEAAATVREQDARPYPVIPSLELEVPFDRSFDSSRKHRLAVTLRNQQVTAQVIDQVQPELIFLWSQLRLTTGPARAAEASAAITTYTMNDDHWAGFLPKQNPSSARDWIAYLLDQTWSRRATSSGLAFDNVTAISGVLKDKLRERGFDLPQMQVIHQGIPLEVFPQRDPRASTLEEPSDFRVLYAGQLHDYKGVHTVIDAMHQWQRAQPDRAMQLTIAGEGPEEYSKRLHELAEAGPCTIDFLGRVPHHELGALYRNADAFVFPSIWPEPFGLTFLEAMASGTPVIATPHGGQGEVLVDKENALLVPAEDVPAWAQALQRLADDEALRTRLQEQGRHLVESTLNLDAYTDRLEAFLTHALQKEGKAA